MSRWLIKLEGERFDLEEFPRWFRRGETFAVEFEGSYYLTGPAFNNFVRPLEVYEAAHQVLDEYSAIISLIMTSLVRPSLGTMIFEDDSGAFIEHHVLLAESGNARSKFGAEVVYANGKADDVGSDTLAEKMLETSRSDRRLKLITEIWADPIRTWPRLYRLLEEIEAYVGGEIDCVGLCLRAQRVRFTRSANTAEIAGRDARHREGKFAPPQDPMSLSEATVFIGDLIGSVLRGDIASK